MKQLCFPSHLSLTRWIWSGGEWSPLLHDHNTLLILGNTACPKKNVVSWKNSHNYPQTHPKCKCWGCIGKFRIFATRWALIFSKLKKKWLRERRLKMATPLIKLGGIHYSQNVIIAHLCISLMHLGLSLGHTDTKLSFFYFLATHGTSYLRKRYLVI